MILISEYRGRHTAPFPRVCGGAPHAKVAPTSSAIFPVFTGVILETPQFRLRVNSFSRARGGDPRYADGEIGSVDFSPHPRG